MSDPFRLLLVDDSETVAGMLSYILESEGYATETAGDGMEALRAVFRQVPDLVLMAVRMPRLDGIQACRLFKAEAATRDVPVILLTSQELGPERIHAERAGAERCLLRDSSAEEISSTIRELLEGKVPRPAVSPAPGGKAPDDLEFLSRLNALLEDRLFEATIANEISRVGREVDDFEATMRAMFHLLRDIVPHEAMGVVFTDGVQSECVTVVSDGSGEGLRGTVRQLTGRLRDESGVPFSPDRTVWTEVVGAASHRGAEASGALKPLAVRPIRSGEMVKGVLALYSSGGAASPSGGAQTEALLRHAFMVLENSWLYRQIARMSVTDGLTGLTNVRHFRETMRMEHARAKRHNDPYAILMVDIDHFKKVNDVYGHPVGDTVLRELASVLRDVVRTTDLPARYGGEEFIVFLPQTRLPEASIVGERLRKAVERQPFAAPSPLLRCTVSVGIADFRPGSEGSEREIIARADQALYEAKRGGRNRVACDEAKET
jgi:two-component system cell cycle response regulator